MAYQSPDMTMSSVVLTASAYIAIGITDYDNFTTILDQHVKVYMRTAVKTAHNMTMN